MSLECAINPGSFPKPIIEWVRHTAGNDPGDEEVVEENEPNIVRFVDDGRYLILETTSEAIADKAYYCRVTNSEFEAGRAPTTYTFNIGQSLNLIPSIFSVVHLLDIKTCDIISCSRESCILITLDAHAQRGLQFINSHLISGASVCPENTVTYSAGNRDQKGCRVFSETASLQTPSIENHMHGRPFSFGKRACAL